MSLADAVNQHVGDITTKRGVQGGECGLGSRDRGGREKGEGYWLVASSIIIVVLSAVTYPADLGNRLPRGRAILTFKCKHKCMLRWYKTRTATLYCF